MSTTTSYDDDDWSDNDFSDCETEYEEETSSIDSDGYPIMKKYYRKKTTPSPPPVSDVSSFQLTVLESPFKLTDDRWGCKLHPVPVQPEIKNDVSSIATILSSPPKPVWESIDTSIQRPDPWSFLEKKQMESERRVAPVSLLTASYPESNKLCKYKNICRMKREGNCTMVHSLEEWKPKVCRFDRTCKKKTQCGYYHHDMSTRDYLELMINKKDNIYSKNSHLYQHYLNNP